MATLPDSSSTSFAPHPRSARRIILLVASAVILATLYLSWPHLADYRAGSYSSSASQANLDKYTSVPPKKFAQPHTTKNNVGFSTTLVAGRFANEPNELAWLDHLDLPMHREAIYIVDDPKAPLSLPRNHGRESAVYLQYILQHYDNLTDLNFFVHSHAAAWHNNLLFTSPRTAGSFNSDADASLTSIALNRLDFNHVARLGYFNTRCDANPGCGKWIRFNPTANEHAYDPTRLADIFTPQLWTQLFGPREPQPQYLSAPCCSQFVVTRDAIRSRPRDVYRRIADWIAGSEYDMYTGRAMEVLWHYVFTGADESCPAVDACYCEAYGLCFGDDGAGRRGAALLEQYSKSDFREHELGFQLNLIKTQLQRADPQADPEKDDEHAAVVARLVDVQKRTQDLKKSLKAAYAIGTDEAREGSDESREDRDDEYRLLKAESAADAAGKGVKVDGGADESTKKKAGGG